MELATKLKGLGMVLLAGVIIKASIIGFYSNEVPWLIGVGVVAIVLLLSSQWLDDQASLSRPVDDDLPAGRPDEGAE